MEALVVGSGLMGRWHAHAIAATGGTVIGVVDPDPVRAAALASRHRGACVFALVDAALAARVPDVVHICTPTATHGPLIGQALKAGCHVLAEKPLASTAHETRTLLDQAARASRLLVPVHQFLFQRGVGALLERLPRIGPVLYLDAGTASAGAVAANTSSVDEIVAEILPHFLGLTRRVLGIPLADQVWSVGRSRPGEWRVQAQCGAASVSFLISMSARPTFAELRVLGERGSARLDLFHGFGIFEPGRVSRSAKIRRPFRLAGSQLLAASTNIVRRAVGGELAYPGLQELVGRFYLAAAREGPSPISPEETLDIALARDRLIALSGSSGGQAAPSS